MDDRGGPEWFAPKKFGFGARPVTWQGWAVLVAFFAVAAAAGHWLGDRPVAMAGVLVPATAVMILITVKTTLGGFRWRWGKEDEG
jgi:hypothetical protein